MKFLRGVSALALLVGIVAIAASLLSDGYYGGKALLMQRAQVDAAEAQLFGDTGITKIGKPALMIVEDVSLRLPGKGDDGAVLLDDKKLQAKGVYPLQLQTVKYLGSMARLGGAIAAGLGALGLFFLRKRAELPSSPKTS